MFMDDANLPVSLKRLMTMIKENTKFTTKVIQEEVLMPYEIMKYKDEIY